MSNSTSWANYVPSFSTVAKGTAASVVGFSSLSLGLLYYGQSYLIYPAAFPPGSRTEVAVPTDFGITYDDLELETPDKVKIRAYLLTQRKQLAHAAWLEINDDMTDSEFSATRPTIMMFHGNGGNAGHRIPLAKVFYLRMRCNVLMLSYRGYGRSQGNPSEKGIRMDAQTALDYLTSHPYLSQTSIMLYGQSIGGAVAIDLCSRNPNTIKALILENTFLSLPRLIPTAVPVLSPFSFLCHQKWDSASKLPLIPPKTPILMLSGTKDEIVPNAHMYELERMLRTPDGPKGARRPGNFVVFEEGRHNDTCIKPGYWNTVAEFVASVQESLKKASPARL